MRFFIIAKFIVHDIPTFQKYSTAVGPILANHAGRIRIGAFDISQSTSNPPSGAVVVEFDSAEAAQQFFGSPEYAVAKDLFIASTYPDIVFASEVTI